MQTKEITLLYRPVNQTELDLIARSGYKRFPPRLPDQPIFYPVMNEGYAIQITKEWNVPAYGVGYVTRSAVDSIYLQKFAVQIYKNRESSLPKEDKSPAIFILPCGSLTKSLQCFPRSTSNKLQRFQHPSKIAPFQLCLNGGPVWLIGRHIE